jgi:CheY-like chemotaxis protein
MPNERKKVLVADDQSTIRELVIEALSQQNLDFLECESGVEALAMVHAQHPDVIIADIMMPGALDGLEVVRRIKADPETRHCKCVLLTAKTSGRDVQQGLATGADHYFYKPFNLAELASAVNSLLKTIP